MSEESRHRRIHCAIWSDEKFVQLDDDAKLVWFHAFTNEYTTGIGIYKASTEALAADLRWDMERFRKAFDKLLETNLIRYDNRAHCIFFPRFFKWNPGQNPNQLVGMLKAFASVPKSPLKREAYEALRRANKGRGPKFDEAFEKVEVALPEPSANLPETFQEPSRNRDRDRDRDRDVTDTVHSADADAPSAPENPKPKRNGYEYPEDFERLWAMYPSRDGPNPKRSAYQCWNARRKEGCTVEQIENGLRRYAQWAEGKGLLNTDKVMQARTFLGPDYHFDQPFTAPGPKRSRNQSAADEAKRRFHERQQRAGGSHDA